jgi:DNA-binding NarL/FixJ family response regulator
MAKAARKLRALLADDHELVRRGVRNVLQADSCIQIVGEASDGQQAVELAGKLRPDVAIMDIGMPGIDGIEASRRIRRMLPGICILVLTMHQSDEIVRQVLEAGARGFVLKSDLADSLLTAVRSLARGGFYLAPQVSEVVLNGFLKVGRESSQGPLRASPSPRQAETLRLLAAGKTNKEVAASMGITVKTAQTYRERIMQKLNLHSTSDLVRYAIRHKLIEA